MSPVVAVTGPAGTVGREVVRELLARGVQVRALDPDPGRIGRAFGNAVEAVEFEFGIPSTYAAAFRGVDRLFLMRPPHITDVEHLIHPAVRAAIREGVGHVVFLSLQGVEKNRVVPHAKIEKYLVNLGLPYTMLRPGFFMQNLVTTHRQDIISGEILVPAGHGRTSFVDVRDIAAVAALALTEPGHEFRAYEITGSEALTYDEAARILSSVLGRRVQYRNPSPWRFWRAMRARGHPPGFVLVMIALYTVCRLGLAARVTGETERLLGRRPISFAQFAHDYRYSWT